MRPKVYAHRGFSSVAPENTIAAFNKALEIGVSGIELDVQLSKDGIPMVFHDEKLDRTTNNQGFLASFTCAELKKLDAGSWFSKTYAGEKIPTLEEVLQLLSKKPHTAVELNIELKTGIVDYPDLEEIVLDLTAQYQIQSRTIYSSFNHYSLKKIKELDSTARIGILYVAGIYEPWTYAVNMGAEALHPLFYNIQPLLVKEAHLAGVKLNPWTVDDPKIMKKMIECGVDGIITNYPDRLLQILQGSKKEV